MASKHNVAVIGAGDMGGRHVAGWTALGHRVVSITDVDQARAAGLAAQHRVQATYTDYHEAIACGDVEIVSIALPLAFHAPVTIFAAGHGKHVFCEKPLARSMTEARAMEAAVNRAGVQFGLGMQRNLAGGVGLLRQWAAEGRFGRPMIFSSDLLQEVRPKRVMHDRHGNNGPLMDAGCHYYLLWQTVFRAKPKNVYAQGRILATGRPEVAHFGQLAIDSAVVTVEFESGDIGTMTVSWGLAERFAMPTRPDRVFGPNGGAEGNVQRQLTVYDGDQAETVDIETKDLHEAEFAIFADAIATGAAPASGFETGKQMLALTNAIFRSIDSGRAVPVSYDF